MPSLWSRSARIPTAGVTERALTDLHVESLAAAAADHTSALRALLTETGAGELASHIFVVMDNGKWRVIADSPQSEQQLFDLEYGTVDSPPRAVVRGFETAMASRMDDLYDEMLEVALVEVLGG